MMTSSFSFAILLMVIIQQHLQLKGEKEMSSYKTLTSIVAWTCFIFGMISTLVPTILGITSGALAGGINDVDAGKLWFYRHGLSYLIGLGLFFGYLFAARVRKELE